MEIRDLQHLLSLDQHRHFGRAAKSVGLSQPALTKSLQRLEQDLGVKLFDRSRARVHPTAVGQEVIARATKLVAAAEDLKRTVDSLCGADLGTVAVGIGPAMSESYVTLAIAAVAEEHPRAQINVRVDHWHQLSDWLLDGELDFFVADIAEAIDDSRFHCTDLPAQKLVWFCRAAHPLAGRELVTRSDMLQYPLATPRMPGWAKDWFTAGIVEQPGSVSGPSFPTVECENYAMLKQIVLAGNCISAALRGTIEKELEEGLVMILPLQAPDLTTHAGIVRLHDRTLSPLAHALIAKIEQFST